MMKDDKWDSMLLGIADVEELPELPRALVYVNELDDGLVLYRVSSPNGVLLVIFRVRIEAIVDAGLAWNSSHDAHTLFPTRLRVSPSCRLPSRYERRRNV
ncbi:hypothetical protein BD414DRAFT_488962 [Trametes punicea]|nr:hypothetical protein BD414DRAFT_488962 [Trametes punicea]